jgi:hypothetical protein
MSQQPYPLGYQASVSNKATYTLAITKGKTFKAYILETKAHWIKGQDVSLFSV